MENLKEELEQLQESSVDIDRRYNRISFARLGVFLVALGGVVLLILRFWWAAVMVVGAALVFVRLVILHSRLENEQNMINNRIHVLEQWIDKKNLDWKVMEESGAEYLKEDDYIAKDLDLLGTHSLYQMICVAHTPAGKNRLAETLILAERGSVDEPVITERQQAIRELTDHREFRLKYETLAIDQAADRTAAPSADPIADHSAEVSIDHISPAITVLAFLIPCLLLVGIVGTVLGLLSPVWILVVYFAGLFLSFVLAGYCGHFLEPVFGKQQLLRSNLALMETVAEETFRSELLVQLQTEIKNDTEQNAMKGMKRLERLLSIYHLRHNPIVHFILSGISLYDVHLARAAVKWNREYHDQIDRVMGILAELEMLNSYAFFADSQVCSYPVIDHGSRVPFIRIQKGYHPFLAKEQAVRNSIELDARPRVITGSNMSGKTTFLRMIGINVILAYAGAPVCAEHMDLAVMRPYTSMRVTDDVNHGISTFYAEILRIKEMVEYGSSQQPMLCLIDEIFKGTNSADRIVGAEAVIRRLTGSLIIPIISTHDFELCDLAENYHFEEYYDEEGIHFDYQLKSGRCQTTNALYLLKMAGLN